MKSEKFHHKKFFCKSNLVSIDLEVNREADERIKIKDKMIKTYGNFDHKMMCCSHHEERRRMKRHLIKFEERKVFFSKPPTPKLNWEKE